MVRTLNVNHVIAILVITVAAAMLQGTEAKKYRVGGNLGWTIPPGGAATYSSWASKYTFKVNKDLLGKLALNIYVTFES